MKMEKSFKVLAGIVTYNPDIERLRENIDSIINQVEQVILVDNGSNNVIEIEEILAENSELQLLKNGGNIGIAAALNKIGDYAVQENFDFFYTLDQDSVSFPNSISEMLKYNELPNIGLLNTYHKDRNFDKEIGKLKLWENPCMITSGTLMPTKIFEKNYRYDERLFIDKVDYDIDISLMDAGFKLYQVPVYGLLHEVGAVDTKRLMGRQILVYNHSSIRRYYISRNTVLLIKKHGIRKITIKFLVDDIVKTFLTILYEENKVKKLVQTYKGYRDGIKYKDSWKKLK